jgi:hypothetical protein
LENDHRAVTELWPTTAGAKVRLAAEYVEAVLTATASHETAPAPADEANSEIANSELTCLLGLYSLLAISLFAHVSLGPLGRRLECFPNRKRTIQGYSMNPPQH